MRKHFVWLLIAIVILTACGGQEPEQKQSAPDTPAPTLVPATLLIWTSDPLLQTALGQLAKDFEAFYPQLSLTLTQHDVATFRQEFEAEVAKGAGPDLMIASGQLLPEWAQQGAIMPLDAAALRELVVLSNREAVRAGYWDEQLYGFPLRTDVPLIYINTTKVSTPIDSFDAFLRSAEASGAVVQADFQVTAGWATTENFQNPFNVGGDLILGSATFTEYLGRLLTLRDTQNVSFSDDPSPFMEGQIGLYVGSSRQMPSLRQALGDALGVMPLQPTAAQQGYPLVDVTMMMTSLNATDSSLAAAQAFISFLVQPEQQTELSQLSGYPPILPNFTDDLVLQAAADAASKGIVLPSNSTFYPQALPRFNTAIAQVLSGALTPEQASASIFGEP